VSLQERADAAAALLDAVRRDAALQAERLRREVAGAQQEAAGSAAQLAKLQVGLWRWALGLSCTALLG
jgi:hypothetical protein